MNSEPQISSVFLVYADQLSRHLQRLVASAFICSLFILSACSLVFAQNDLQRIEDGGQIERWLISNVFPAEIDAGTWENFNRFNLERLPEKDWLAPFGGAANIKPQIGTIKAASFQIQSQSTPNQSIQNAANSANALLPEVGAGGHVKALPDAAEITWRELRIDNPQLDFYSHADNKQIGTAYAASLVNSAQDELHYIETDGFLGTIWLNGEKIYDGFVLNAPRRAAAKFRRGENRLLVRSTGIAGDHWRSNHGFAALIRVWKSEAGLNKALETRANSRDGTIFYLEGFHVDPVYLHDQRGYTRITLSNTNQYLQSLRADERYGVFLSEIDYLKPYLDTHPEDREFLRQAVGAGRVGAGGAYNQFNELTIGGESIIRNILYGQLMHETLLGRRAKSLSLWDVFGHAPQISQIARKAGFNGITWSKKISGFEPFFFDYALDGTRLLHRRVDYAYSFSGFGSGKNYALDDFRQMTMRKFAETSTYGSAVDLRINAADFTPPWTNLAGNVKKLEVNKPKIRVTGQAQDLYFDALNREVEAGKVKPPVTSRDKLFFHVGVMAARSDLKVAHRLAENITLTAEKFGTIAYLRGAKYPDLALDKAWRQILFGSHHDAITGTPSDNAFLDLIHGYREAFELSKEALDDSLDFIAKQIKTNPNFQVQSFKSQIVPIVVFNPMSWKRTDLVRAKVEFDRTVNNFQIRDESGEIAIPHFVSRQENKVEFEFVAKDVPSLGYKTFYVEPLEERRVSFDKSYPDFLENEFYQIRIDVNRGGAITSIYDKQANREIVNPQNGHLANEIAVLAEELTKKNVIYPAWEFWTTGKKSFSSETKASFSYNQNGATQTFKIQGILPNKTGYLQTIALHKGVKRIDFKTELVDYAGKDELFTVNFPLSLTGGALVTEDRFGTVVRNNSKGFLDFKTNTDKLVSGAPVYAVNNWAEYGSTLNLNFVDGRKVVSSVPLKPIALIRPHGASYEKATETIVRFFIKRGVSATPFYDDNDEQRRKSLTIEDSTMPKKLNDDIAYHNFRILIGDEKENLHSAAVLKQVSAEIKAKFNERLLRDGLAYLFIYDKDVPSGWQAMPTLLIAGNLEKAVEDLLAPIERGEFELNISAESLADTNSLPKVENYGVALINNGTAAVSLENPNTLVLFLTHTAPFPGVNLPFSFVPEHKTHVFNYALYPHEKDWREAETVKVGSDFNNPLIAKQTDLHAGDLPNQHSFLDVNSEKRGVVLSALKLGGNPQADFQNKAAEKRRKVVLRFNETEGRKSPLSFNFSPYNDDTGWHDVHWTLRKTDLLETEIPNTEVKQQNFPRPARFIETIENFGIETFSLNVEGQLSHLAQPSGQPLGATKELVQPVFSRYWLHNTGAAPLGNDAVKVSLRRLEQENELSTFAYDDKYNQGGTTTVAVRVQVVNNYQDQNYKGEVELEAPPDWRVVPDKLEFDIAPNGSFVKDVVVVAFPVKKDLEWERASGLIKARIEHDGQTFQDVLNLGKPFKLEWTTEKTQNGVAVKIKNSHRQAIEGAVALIVPPEAWALGEPKFPRELGFSVPARSEIVLNLPVTSSDNWAIARVAYNGHVEYQRADLPK